MQNHWSIWPVNHWVDPRWFDVWSAFLFVCSVDWFVSLLVREEVLLADFCERKILFQLEIYDRLRQATAKRTSCHCRKRLVAIWAGKWAAQMHESTHITEVCLNTEGRVGYLWVVHLNIHTTPNKAPIYHTTPNITCTQVEIPASTQATVEC